MYFSSYEFSKELMATVSTNNHINYSKSEALSALIDTCCLPNCTSYSLCSMCRGCGDRHPRRHLESDGGDQAAPPDVQLPVPVRVAVHEHGVQAGGHACLLQVVLHAISDEPAVPGHPLLHVRAHPEPPEQGRQVQSAGAHGRRWTGGSDCGRGNDAPGRGEDIAEYTGDGNRADKGHAPGDGEGA